MESDCLLLLQLVNLHKENSSYVGLIVEDCKLLLEEILDCSLVFVKRSVNQDNHSLARASGSLPDSPIVIRFINT